MKGMQWGMAIDEISAVHLTGRSRHRNSFWGALILQVELRAPIPRGASPMKHGESVWARGERFFWRDATFEDLQALLERDDWRAGWMNPEEAERLIREGYGPQERSLRP